jgi:hypothetical protein
MKRIKHLWIFLAIVVAFNIIIYLTRWGGETTLLYVSDILPIICSLVASICLVFAIRSFKSFDYVKLAWILIATGIMLNFFAEIVYSALEIVYHIDINEVFPTLADYIWCIAYIPIIAGLLIMFNGYRKSGFPIGNIKIYSLIIPSAVLLLILLIFYLFIPIIQDSETTIIAKIFYLFYPIADMLVILPAIILIYITSLFGTAIISKPWRYLAMGFICFTVSDLIYSYLGWLDVYGNGNLIDLGWNIGYLFIGLSGLYQRQLIISINSSEI